MAEAARKLDDQSVPEDNRWFVAPPIFYEQLSAAASKVMDASVMGDGVSALRNGLVTSKTVAGMSLYKTTALNISGTDIITATGSSNEYYIMAGHMSSTSTASHIAKTEVVRDPDSFSDIVRGLHVYGSKVLRPEALVRTVVTLS